MPSCGEVQALIHTDGPEHTHDPLQASEGMLQLLLASPAVESYLDEVALITERLSSVIAGCGITMRRGTDVMSISVSNDLARAVDEVQYSLDLGPCLRALETGEAISVEDTADEHRFGDYPDHALLNGVRSSFSLPLEVAGRTVAALNSYSRRVRGFDAALRATMVAFASQVQIALELTVRAAAASRVNDQLHAAMQTRSVIDQALGIVMERRRCDAPEAFVMLRAGSQATNRKIYDMAVDLITTTTGRPPQASRFVV